MYSLIAMWNVNLTLKKKKKKGVCGLVVFIARPSFVLVKSLPSKSV